MRKPNRETIDKAYRGMTELLGCSTGLRPPGTASSCSMAWINTVQGESTQVQFAV